MLAKAVMKRHRTRARGRKRKMKTIANLTIIEKST